MTENNLDAILQQDGSDAGEASPEMNESSEITQEQEQEEVSTEPEKTPEKTPEETPHQEEGKEDEPAIPPQNDEVNELRQFIREQRKEIAAMKAKLSRMNEKPEFDDEGNAKVKYTPLEQLQIELHNIAVTRAPLLEVMVDTMSDSTKYADVYEVCTKQNFDDIFETAASRISREENRDFSEVLLQIELEVWKKTNPYKYMYNIIKQYHPKYAVKEEQKTENPKAKAVPAAKVIEPKDAPGSIAAAGTVDGKNSSTWTAARIDDMEESELHTVPADIYKQYMLGKLK